MADLDPDMRLRGLAVLPTRPFLAGHLKKHPEWTEVVHPSRRPALGL